MRFAQITLMTLVAVLLLGGSGCEDAKTRRFRRWVNKIEVGDTRAEIVERLGQPSFLGSIKSDEDDRKICLDCEVTTKAPCEILYYRVDSEIMKAFVIKEDACTEVFGFEYF